MAAASRRQEATVEEPVPGAVDEEWVRRELDAVRRESNRITAPLSDADFEAQHHPLTSPVNWDMGHVAWFEELWLVAGLDGPQAQQAHQDDRYVAAEYERHERASLALPTRSTTIKNMQAARRRTLGRLETIDLADGNRLLEDWFVHRMVLNHERQHQENMLTAMQFVPGARYEAPRVGTKPQATSFPRGMAFVPSGAFTMGSARRAGTYDNEWGAHEVYVDSFEIDVAPVTNGQFLDFIEAGGYAEPSHWPNDQQEFYGAQGIHHPLHWSRNSSGEWFLREFDLVMPLPLDQPVSNIGWEEASAYASWAGKRLPTEAEWEKAATWDPRAKAKRVFPWGNSWVDGVANVGAKHFGPAPVGAYPGGVSAVGCHQMVGDVWEWTQTEFDAFPGFEAFPYPEYSQPFFGDDRFVLKGGCWATHWANARPGFRNWYYPNLRHVMAGFRCARDAEAAA